MGCNAIEKKGIVFVINGPLCSVSTQCEKVVKNFQYKSFFLGNFYYNMWKIKKMVMKK